MFLNNIHLSKTVILATKDWLCIFRKTLTATLRTKYSDLLVELVVFRISQTKTPSVIYGCLTNISARTANK